MINSKRFRYYTTPDGAEVTNMIEMFSSPLEDDWTDIFTEAFDKLHVASSNRRQGTIVLNGLYPLKKPLFIPPFVQIIGAWPVGWHGGYSCGFKQHDSFEGETLLNWISAAPRRYYSNFGAGMKDVFVGLQGANGIQFQGSQQASRLEGVVIRGFGENGGKGYGIKLIGDTYVFDRVSCDARLSRSGTKAGTIGFKTSGNSLVSVQGRMLTVHNCGVGFDFVNLKGTRVQGFDSETTDIPIRMNHGATSAKFVDCNFQHNDLIIDIKRARWGKSTGLFLEGISQAGTARLPSGEKRYLIEKNGEFSFDARDLL